MKIKMNKIFSIVFFFLSASALFAQLPYTTAGEFSVRTETNIVFGIDTNYMGYTDTLLLDLYKPIGDNNTNRPLLVLIHGGSWLGGCKDETGTGIVPLANEFASRGYTVASVDYRLGWHKDDYVALPASAPWPETAKSLYAADSNEMIRAIFRGMQDVKGAVRFLKARNETDSTCINNVYVGGESAGAFVAFAVAFLDRESEKPSSCFTIADAPDPQDNLPNAVADCAYHTFSITSSSLKRNDLGSVEGKLHTGTYDAKIQGVISFFGGVPAEAFSKNWFENNPEIPVYMYHQTCDGIVNFSYGQPMKIISDYCNLGYDPWHFNYPNMFGNGAIYDSLYASGGFTLLSEFQYCDPFLIPLFDCIRYADNGSYHYTSNVAERAITISEFLSPVISEHESDAVCKLSTEVLSVQKESFSLFPNPVHEMFYVKGNFAEGVPHIEITDMRGKTVPFQRAETQNTLRINMQAEPGMYFIKFLSEEKTETLSFMKL